MSSSFDSLQPPSLHFVLCPHGNGMSVHRLAYWQWLPPSGRAFQRTCVAVHGLTRNGRDYDVVASRLAADGWRVIAVDFVGRGQSEWLNDAALYGYPQYVSDMVVLLARLDIAAVDLWLGTSMGGLTGMFVAAMPQQLIKRMILVDVGPMIPSAAIVRIKNYVGADPRFKRREDAVAACRAILQTFGPHTDEQAELVIRHYIVEKEGQWRFHYDPRIAAPFKAAPDVDVVLWPVWDQIKCPVLVLRGGNSDLLLEATAAEMQTRGPPAVQVVTFAGVGHAPTLIVDDQVAAVLEFAAKSAV